MKKLIFEWQKIFSEKIKNSFGVEIPPEKIAIDFPQKVEFGDVTTNVAFAVAKAAKKNPVEVAERISEVKLPFIKKIETKGAYINLFLDRRFSLNYIFPDDYPSKKREKVIVEHTNINPNKAAHIGHLRNAVLGDTLVRTLRFLGFEVEVQNYIDDTG
ncbi:MAG: arginine--tRNA ligase, partial [Acidobacteria bacterium]|nr:arginine--tRNA ligase [Acidobacteriota bacterium]